jgi:hypothetical protein
MDTDMEMGTGMDILTRPCCMLENQS